MAEFLELLAAGGDMATIALCAVLWRLDRRLLLVETKLQNLKERIV